MQQQNDLIKRNNDGLVQTITDLINKYEGFDYQSRNRELEDMLETERKRYEELENRRYQEMRSFKEELNDKNNEI